MDKAHQIAPLVAVLNGGDRTLPGQRPDFLEQRLEPNAMLIYGPQLDSGVWERRRDLAQKRPQFFLKAACASESAWM
jgi:hypothetical protein